MTVCRARKAGTEQSTYKYSRGTKRDDKDQGDEGGLSSDGPGEPGGSGDGATEGKGACTASVASVGSGFADGAVDPEGSFIRCI